MDPQFFLDLCGGRYETTFIDSGVADGDEIVLRKFRSNEVNDLDQLVNELSAEGHIPPDCYIENWRRDNADWQPLEFRVPGYVPSQYHEHLRRAGYVQWGLPRSFLLR